MNCCTGTMKKSRDPLDVVILLGCVLGEEALKH
jgi:hypothetical protein